MADQIAIAPALPPEPGKRWTRERVYENEKGEQVLDLAVGEQPTALCLSGGGIRSAAFCLGALQGLARGSLLGQFHYLSTVSGGGYIGGWLTRCIAENDGDIAKVETQILARKGMESDEIRRLRRYVNYLTPRPGPASNDVWAGVTLWVRNTLINWAVFLPLMMAAMMLPILYADLVGGIAVWRKWHAPIWGVLGGLALVGFAAAVYDTCVGLPSHKHPDPANMPAFVPRAAGGPDPCERLKVGLSGGQIRLTIILPALVWVFFIPLTEAGWLEKPHADWHSLFHSRAMPADANAATPNSVIAIRTTPTGVDLTVSAKTVPKSAAKTSKPTHPWPAVTSWTFWHLALLPSVSFVVCLLAYGCAWLRLRNFTYQEKFYQQQHDKAFRKNLLAWVISSALSAGLLLVGLHLADGADATGIAILGPIWVVAADVLRTTVYVAVRREGLRSDLDREWLARVSGAKIRTVLVLGGLGALATIGPKTILDSPHTVWTMVAGVIGFAAGPVGAFIGSSARTAFLPEAKDGAKASLVRPRWLVEGTILVFMLSLLMVVGRLDFVIVRAITACTGWADRFAQAGAVGLCLGLVCLVAGFAFGRATDLNRFSMHSVYRNRLVRAFLGTARSRKERHPDRYTSFDPEDDIVVWDTFTGRVDRALYPVINVALNRTSGHDTARAERKAAPFIITPRHCGSSFLDDGGGAYVNTNEFARGDMLSGPDDKRKGITLGTAMTLSGAAVSPNMGYNSSPLTAFVMTLFNLRLGAWLPNPGRANASSTLIEMTGPENAVPNMLEELAGRSDDEGRFVYLSDGGHFDNLGLYEMLARGCGKILVVDAGRDQSYGYADLGRVLQRVGIDMNITVNFIGPLKVGDPKLDPQGAHARITYADGREGELIYIKPWIPDDAPAELRAYGVGNQDFPHDPTIDQFFTESDFESYRRLGQHLTDTLVDDAVRAGTPRPKPAALSWRQRRDCGPVRPANAAPNQTGPLETVFLGVARLSGAVAPEPASVQVLQAMRRKLSGPAPPTLGALQALWWVAKGDLQRAHDCVRQHAGDPACDLVHAHLHRRQGEGRLARYWYRRAGRGHAHLPIAEEWEVIAKQLLAP